MSVGPTAHSRWESSRCTPHRAPWQRHSPGQYCTHRWTGRETSTWSRCGCRRRCAWPCALRRRQRWGGGERPARPRSTGCCSCPKERARLAQSPLLDAPPGPPSSIWGTEGVVRRKAWVWVILVQRKLLCNIAKIDVLNLLPVSVFLYFLPLCLPLQFPSSLISLFLYFFLWLSASLPADLKQSTQYSPLIKKKKKNDHLNSWLKLD